MSGTKASRASFTLTICLSSGQRPIAGTSCAGNISSHNASATDWPIILLARDPRDAFVSLFIQLTRRTKETPDELKQKPVSELVRDPAFGIESMVEVMNNWLTEWSDRPDFLLLRYETLRESPAPGFRDLLRLLG